MNTELHGLITDMTNEAYHSSPGTSKSGLDKIARSPAHYWAAYLDPEREPTEPTPAMRMGTLIHTAILEPDTLDARTILAPEGIDRRTKDGKAAWAAFQAEAAGREIITPDEHTTLLRIRDRVHSHPVAGPLLADGVAEQSYFARDEETGLLIKCRPDWMTSNGIMVDVKSTEDASPDGFGRSVVNYRYHVQAAWYLDILQRLYGEAPQFFMFIAVEKSRPHVTEVYFADDDQIAAGRAQYRKDLNRLAECIQANDWPGYCTEVQPLKLPSWFKLIVA